LSQAAVMVGGSLSPIPWLRCAVAGAKGFQTHEQKIRELRAATPDLPRGYFLKEPGPAAPVTNLLLRGKASRPGSVVPCGMPALLVSSQPAFLWPGERSSRRRLTLARWIASR